MERVFPMKFVRLAVLVGVCLVPACNKPAPVAPATTPTAMKPVATVTSPSGGTPSSPTDDDDARQAGRDFLAALKAGRATPAMLTPEFRAVLAPAGGGSDWAVGNWLGEFRGDAGAVSAQNYVRLDAETFLVVADSLAATPPMAFTYAKLVRVPGPAKFAVGWLHSSPPRPAAVVATSETFAAFVGVAFVDTVLTKQTRLAESLIAPAAAKKLAPPLDDEDAKLGYNRGILGLKLNGFREAFTSVTYGAATKAGANLTLAGELTGPGSERRKFVVTVAPVGSSWFVEDFRHD